MKVTTMIFLKSCFQQCTRRAHLSTLAVTVQILLRLPNEWSRDRIFPTTCVPRELLINLEESTSFDITVLKFSVSAFAAQRKAILRIPHWRAYLVLRPDMHFMMALWRRKVSFETTSVVICFTVSRNYWSRSQCGTRDCWGPSSLCCTKYRSRVWNLSLRDCRIVHP